MEGDCLARIEADKDAYHSSFLSEPADRRRSGGGMPVVNTRRTVRASIRTCHDIRHAFPNMTRLLRQPSRAALCACFIALAPALCAAIEVNAASRAELEQLGGLGPSKVERMLLQRERKPFADWADLQRRVGGLGAKTAEQLSREGLTVNGQPYRDSAAASAPR
ncbi:MAG: helix-hairpin-helix domain-containing protein [Burkholderiaceae bacterium]|nr:helix-hairpin-helix domain-containing protein [Burkholderiaceae bacterium]